MTAFIDQQTDRSQAVLTKIAAELHNGNVEDILKSDTVAYGEKCAAASERFADQENRLFPVDSFENTVTSAAYFNFQKTAMEESYVARVGGRLSTFMQLYDIPEDVFSPLEKQAENVDVFEEEVLLQGDTFLCKVASAKELENAGAEFARSYLDMDMADRVEFSKNFIKAASKFKVKNFPEQVSKYAAELDTDLSNVRMLLEYRQAAALRSGFSGAEYAKLASALGSVNEAPTRDECIKLAETVHSLDIDHGFDQPKYDRKMPDAYGVVFSKHSEVETKSKETSKADLVGRFGPGVLDAVEDDEGNIDPTKLKHIIRLKEAHNG